MRSCCFVGLSILLLAMASVGCKRSTPANAPASNAPATPAPKAWTADEIAQDPEGYLAAQGRQIQDQITQRDRRLLDIRDRKRQIEGKKAGFEQNYNDVKNVHDRMQRAYDQAMDEDRWPMQAMGRTFTQEKAKAIIKSTQQYLDDRQPLAEAYDGAAGRLQQVEAAMQNQIQDLKRLQDKVSLDLERVKLNANVAEIADLKKTATEIANFTGQLGKLDENVLNSVAVSKDADRQMDVETLLK